ncbi:branched-chain amino acid ABC transporter permease [Ochrobactrum chromiisoli]|uniref:Branched-chain amino acid ABC transporter permease n=1 Tax=Ochrobactrum chromiisoli TaxID=2993941 RepID=A0ABT3QSX1_9HYPH|nr:branched-chain amino acid ABC transporter permease [Ochrobactrum chromiisoli]MCX2698707.1 branched-chain amino acid ABC transporter permease [Ochrobactrum chromiisoli]
MESDRAMVEYFLQQLIFALVLGAIYGLIALGYTMVYGVMRLINFAHGEFFMLGPYIYTFIFTGLIGAGGITPVVDSTLAIVGSFIAVGLLGVAVERFAYRPLRAYGRLAPMLSALGMSIVLQSAVRVTVGPQPVHFPAIINSTQIQIFGGTISTIQIGILVSAVFLMIGLTTFVNKTRFGIWIRAASESWTTSALLGIRVNRAVSLIFFVGPGLGAMAGIMYSSYYGIMQPSMGSVIGLKAFTAAILGGIGSIPGAMLGGFLLGGIEVFGTALIPVISGGLLGTEYRDVFAFAVLILVLLFKPSGLLGETVSEETTVAKKDY